MMMVGDLEEKNSGRWDKGGGKEKIQTSNETDAR
jgi:hypothetical protein